LARRVEVVPPPEANTVEVDLSLVDGDLDQLELAVSARDGHTTALPAARSVALEAAGERLTIELRSRRRLDHRGDPTARLTPWPVVRRALAESRDRLRPLVR
jgi:hypothetical protein